jgi:precorrin-2/cobalt-factor-2 C20-methyltransferase
VQKAAIDPVPVTSTMAAAVQRLRPGHPIDTVPGITAMQELSARAGRPLVTGDERLSLVPLLAGPESLDAAVGSSDCLVLYKAGRHLGPVLARLSELGLRDRAVYGERLGTAAERVCGAGEVAEEPGPYMSTLLIWGGGDSSQAAPGGLRGLEGAQRPAAVPPIRTAGP